GGEVLARKDYESAQADLAQASAETRRAAQRLSNLNAGPRDDGGFGLRAPIDGVVAERQLNPGQEVRPDLPNPLFVVTDLRHLWLVVDVPERGAGAIAAGQDVAL
ncbi:efflux RND transporter periplasmic adaptor subunit, partial [Rugamonas apoptosis]